VSRERLQLKPPVSVLFSLPAQFCSRRISFPKFFPYLPILATAFPGLRFSFVCLAITVFKYYIFGNLPLFFPPPAFTPGFAAVKFRFASFSFGDPVLTYLFSPEDYFLAPPRLTCLGSRPCSLKRFPTSNLPTTPINRLHCPSISSSTLQVFSSPPPRPPPTPRLFQSPPALTFDSLKALLLLTLIFWRL